MIRQQIWEATQCTATVGVSKNKLLAKLATDKVKPNRSHLVESHRELLQDLELRCLHGIGHRTDRKLAGEKLVTIQDVWNLGDHAESELSRILGPGLGKKIFGFCNGEDDRPIQAAERKTIGAEVG
jgi:DNA repair protein REV1